MLYKCRKSIECSVSTWSAKIINNVNCCDTGNGADIELIIVGVAGGVARGVVSKLSVSLMCFGVSYRTRNRIFNLCDLNGYWVIKSITYLNSFISVY